MKHTLLFVFLTTFITGIAQENTKDYTEAFLLAEVWLEAQKDYENIPGLSAIVIQKDEVLWSGGFGMANPEGDIKTDSSTICSICSISKLFTSVAIMRLYDEGKLRLDDQVKDLLPHYNLKQKYPHSGNITVRTLLTHSSGLPREAGYPYWDGPDFVFPSREEINSKLGSQETLYEASTYFQYSNLGMSLLGQIIEEISGMPYEDYIEQHILAPLGLKETRTALPEELYGTQLAIGYSAMNRLLEREKVNFFKTKGITPAAGFSSNASDLGKFAMWQLRLRDTTLTEILKPSTLKYMQNIHYTSPDGKVTWGLGFRVKKGPDGNTYVGHGGLCPGYNTTIQIDIKNKRAFAILINANGTVPDKYVYGINSIMNKVTPPGKELTQDKKADLSEYVGHFSDMPYGSEEYIGQWNGKLVSLVLPTDDPVKSMTFFKHVEGDTFQRLKDDKTFGETLVFKRDANGKVNRFERHNSHWKKIEP